MQDLAGGEVWQFSGYWADERGKKEEGQKEKISEASYLDDLSWDPENLSP